MNRPGACLVPRKRTEDGRRWPRTIDKNNVVSDVFVVTGIDAVGGHQPIIEPGMEPVSLQRLDDARWRARRLREQITNITLDLIAYRGIHRSDVR